MLYNSFDFLIFFLVVVLIYYIIPGGSSQRIFLIIASACFLIQGSIFSLVVASLFTLFNFVVARYIEKNNRNEIGKIIFFAAIIIDVANLVLIKKYSSVLRDLGTDINITSNGSPFQLNNLIIPIGISFYTFSVISYLVDVRLNFIKAERNLIAFLNFTFFFPKMLAGPIERIQHFNPQSIGKIPVKWENFSIGGKLIILGIFQKLVVADRISIYVDKVYSDIANQSGITILTCIVLYTFQIYTDFVGYTNIARGLARILGYDLFENFNRPLLSRSITEFWRRWHISLSSWVNDYIYTPLSLNFRNLGKTGTVLSLLISFILIGIWHGFLWTFVFFGIIQGIILTIEFSTRSARTRLLKNFPDRLIHGSGIIFTFVLVSISLVLFRAPSLHDTFNLFVHLTNSGSLYIGSPATFIYLMSGIIFLIYREIQIEFYQKDILKVRSTYFVIRSLPYLFITILIVLFGVLDGGQFIYLQF